MRGTLRNRGRLFGLFFFCTSMGVGCGPAPKSESVLAYEAFLGRLYSGDVAGLTEMLTPDAQRILASRVGVGQVDAEAMKSHLTVELGWQFERVSARQPKVDPNRSNETRQVVNADLGGDPWQIVMKNTATGWKVDLFSSKRVDEKAGE